MANQWMHTDRSRSRNISFIQSEAGMHASPVFPLRSFRAVRSLSAAVLMLVTLAGCAVAPYGEYEPDPAEPVNRIMYGITDLADRVLLEPVTDLYL